MSDQVPSAAAPRNRLSTPTIFVLALMRIGIGWHFLYEGVLKVLDREWTAAGYLRASTGPLAATFQRLADNPAALWTVDRLNAWGLTLIGLGLMLGLFTRLSAFAGMMLLALYYLAAPPLFASMPIGPAEGQYLLINKNLLELLALAVVLFLPARQFGLDGTLAVRRFRRRAALAQLANLEPAWGASDPERPSRRWLLTGLVGMPLVGAFVFSLLKKHGWHTREERNLLARADARSGATIKVFDFSASLKDLKGRLPTAKIGNVTLSRMILGGNLIGGWAHSRDLIYVSKLIKAYHHRQKVFETFRLAEACGINSILTNPVLGGIIDDYRRSIGGKIQFISDCGTVSPNENVQDVVRKSVDQGACACYIQGATADRLVEQGQVRVIGDVVEQIRRSGLPAGIGAHNLSTLQACVKEGLQPDFWVKTLHHLNYWSAKPKEEYDNVWCKEPDETVAFMRERKEPWIAFKVLAAGALLPKDGFTYAFTHGADFICVGMYDFQIVEDANIALDVLAGKVDRQRAWMA